MYIYINIYIHIYINIYTYIYYINYIYMVFYPACWYNTSFTSLMKQRRWDCLI